MGFFGKKAKETTKEDCITMVENFLTNIGLNPAEQRLKGDTTGWIAVRGSAIVYIMVFEYEHFSSIRIYSPILYLPEENILPFYRKCLEINFSLVNCAICVYEDKVALVVERPIGGLDPEELEGMINYLSSVADDLDNKLADEFGAKILSERTD